jgi:hypothetical protein
MGLEYLHSQGLAHGDLHGVRPLYSRQIGYEANMFDRPTSLLRMKVALVLQTSV